MYLSQLLQYLDESKSLLSHDVAAMFDDQLMSHEAKLKIGDN